MLYHPNASEDNDAGSRDRTQQALHVYWGSIEDLAEDPLDTQLNKTATEVYHAIQAYAAAHSVTVALDTSEHCIVFNRA